MGKSTSMKAMKVAKATKPMKSMKLTKDKLKKHDNKTAPETLQEKVDRACEENESPTAAAAALKKSLTKLEHSKIWGQHKTSQKGNADSAASEDAGKKEKGLAAALWFISRKSEKFMNMGHTVGSNITVQRLDQWQSEKQMLDKFSQSEFDAHVASGRVIYREDPMTQGVYQDKDQNDVSRTQTAFKSKNLCKGQEYEPGSDTDEQFDELFDKDFVLQVHF